MKQHQPDWHEWRRGGLGSSDAAAVMGISPWRTPLQLWEEKTGVSKPQETNFAMTRGTELEPKARALFELTTDLEYPPTLFEHPVHTFVRASLDGWNESIKTVLEIKYQGREAHAKTRDEQYVPDHYYCQIQHQLLASNGNQAIFYSYDGNSGHPVLIEPNNDYQKNLLKKLIDFWSLVQSKTPPPLTSRDYKPVDDEYMRGKIRKWRELKENINILEEEEKKLRNEIILLSDHPRIIYDDVKIYRVNKRGTINYKRIPVLKDVDLNEWRNPDVEYWRFDIIRK